MAVPALQKGIRAAENGNTFATMRTIGSTQAGFYSQNGRYGHLNEINNMLGSSLGTQSGNDEIHRGKFVLTMLPAAPTDADLKNGYTVTATRNIASEGEIYVYAIDQSGLNVLFP
jgi:hypothetical protein